jgi:hypothetical protein
VFVTPPEKNKENIAKFVEPEDVGKYLAAFKDKPI